MDLGEQADQKGVVIVEIGPDGRKEEPTGHPLPATPITRFVVLEPSEDIPRLKLEFPNAKGRLVSLQIRYTAGKDQLEEVLRDLDRIFPRWYARDWKETGALGPTLVTEGTAGQGLRRTVRDYLSQELIQHDQTERDAILKITDELLKEMEN